MSIWIGLLLEICKLSSLYLEHWHQGCSRCPPCSTTHTLTTTTHTGNRKWSTYDPCGNRRTFVPLAKLGNSVLIYFMKDKNNPFLLQKLPKNQQIPPTQLLHLFHPLLYLVAINCPTSIYTILHPCPILLFCVSCSSVRSFPVVHPLYHILAAPPFPNQPDEHISAG